jgi:hypothetical protein
MGGSHFVNYFRASTLVAILKISFGQIYILAGMGDQFLAEQPDMSHLFFDNGVDAALA